MQQQEDNRWIVQSNKLIEAQGSASALEKKLFLSIIAKINMQDEDFKEYTLSLDEINKDLKIDKDNIYRSIRRATKGLNSREVVIEEEIDGKRHLLVTNLISSGKYVEGESRIAFRVDPNLKPYLIQLKKEFTRYQVKNVMKLNSFYSIRIYELMKQYRRMKSRKFTIENLRSLLGLDTEYERFYDFERNVLKVAKEEINANTDITLSYEKIKTGRRISHIVFTKETDRSDDSDRINILDTYSDDSINEMSRAMGLEELDLIKEQILSLYEIASETVQSYQKIECDQETIYKYAKYNSEYVLLKRPDNVYAYLKKAYTEDYARALHTIIIEQLEI